MRRIRSVRSGRSPIGVDVAEGPLNVRSPLRAPAAADPSLTLTRIVVGDLFARGRRAGKAIVREIVAAGLPTEATHTAGGAGLCADCVTAAGFDSPAGGRLAALPRDDLHDAANRIGAEERALRTAYDFDPFDIRKRYLREVEAAAKRVGANAVDKDEREVGFSAARKQRGERAGTAASRDGEAGYGAQRVAQRRDLPRLEIAAVNHRDAVSSPRQWLIDLACGHEQSLRDGA